MAILKVKYRSWTTKYGDVAENDQIIELRTHRLLIVFVEGVLKIVNFVRDLHVSDVAENHNRQVSREKNIAH